MRMHFDNLQENTWYVAVKTHCNAHSLPRAAERWRNLSILSRVDTNSGGLFTTVSCSFQPFQRERTKKLETNQRGVNWYPFEACVALKWNQSVAQGTTPWVQGSNAVFYEGKNQHNGCNQCHKRKYAMFLA